MVKIGDKLTFTPSAWAGSEGLGLSRGKNVTGVVERIAHSRQWYRVRYEIDTFAGRVVLHECFPLPPTEAQRADSMPRDGGYSLGVRAPKYSRRERQPKPGSV